jgi:hypothetical protein
MDNKDIIKKLIKIASNQQKIINKLAQVMPTSLHADPVQSLPAPNRPVEREADAILHALPADVRATVERIEVRNNEVLVRFNPGKDSDVAFQTIQKTVNDLQNQNVLPGQSYMVKQVP